TRGEVEFIGRVDDQIKLRGFRIELGEIETALKQHPSIREAVVIADQRDGGDKRLVAYVETEGDKPSSTDLRGYLKKRLPEYMVPALWLQMEKLPLTANGKIDKRGLPPPDQWSVARAGEVREMTPVEELLAGMWMQI